VCIALCTIVAHIIAQNRPDSFPPYPPDNHHISDDVYLREGGWCSTHIKKLTTGNNVFTVSIIVQSNCHILQFLYQMFNVSTSSTLLLENALKRTTLLTYGVINDTLTFHKVVQQHT